MVHSVLVTNPHPRVGELLSKASLEEKAEFYAILSKEEDECKQKGRKYIQDIVAKEKQDRDNARAAAKLAAETAAAERMEPEF